MDGIVYLIASGMLPATGSSLHGEMLHCPLKGAPVYKFG